MKGLQLIPETNDLNKYLNSSDFIDYEDIDIQKTAVILSKDIKGEIKVIKTVYEFVRDDISHSMDIDSEFITVKASDVLKYKQGLCFAKSHLLAAILRFLKIPTGFCYQKLEFEEGFGLHGLNAVFIRVLDKWIRLDSRGNKRGIDAQFSLDKEILAYTPRPENGEIDYPIIYPLPNRRVLEILKESENLTKAVEKVNETEWSL